MLSLAEGALWVSATLLVGGTLGYTVDCAREPGQRYALATATAVGLLLTPWLLPANSPLGRSAVATSILLAIHRVWETATRVNPKESSTSYYHYLCYFLFVPEIRYSATREQRSAAGREGASRLLRGLIHAGATLLAFAALAVWPNLLAHPGLGALWNLLVMYTFCATCCDLIGGSAMLATRHGAVEVFHWPFLAASPREFWGRRWNMTFRNACYRLIFSPLAARNSVLAAALVFIWSAVVHEYVVVAALGRPTFHMTAFFLLQGAAAAFQSLIYQSRRKSPLPRPLAVLLHTAWIGTTSTLFFAPVTEIVQPLELLGMAAASYSP